MNLNIKKSKQTRREFVKNCTYTGALLCLSTGNIFSLDKPEKKTPAFVDFNFKYKTIPVDHLSDLKNDFERVKNSGRLSDNKIYRKYISGFKFEKPEKFLTAKSIIIVAIPQKITTVNFCHNGKKIKVLTPPGYVDDGIKKKDVYEAIYRKILKRRDRKIEIVYSLPMKLMAARSGIGEYGKNNICFVKDMGSYHHLLAFYTDHSFPEDNWGRVKMLRLCKGCYICMKRCPTKCITEENFVIDVGKCITLYNELPDPMPKWIKPETHNALIGCLKCQMECPANLEFDSNIKHLEDISEDETKMILSGVQNKVLWKSAQSKLKKIGLSRDFKHLSKNLKLLLDT